MRRVLGKLSQPQMQYSTNERERTIHAEPATRMHLSDVTEPVSGYKLKTRRAKKIANTGRGKFSLYFYYLGKKEGKEAYYYAVPTKNANV
jgi:hypothetical protein